MTETENDTAKDGKPSLQIALRYYDEFAERIRKEAARNGMNCKELIQVFVAEGLNKREQRTN